MILNKKSLPRRAFLRGMGVTMALPLLDAMTPALASAPKPVVRLGFVYVPNGIIMKKIHRQDVLSTMAPPTNGPSTVAIP